MVTKLRTDMNISCVRFVLAKKLMVTKQRTVLVNEVLGFVLAKKLMVTKPKGPSLTYPCVFCSSEKINGNKTSNSYYHKFKIL